MDLTGLKLYLTSRFTSVKSHIHHHHHQQQQTARKQQRKFHGKLSTLFSYFFLISSGCRFVVSAKWGYETGKIERKYVSVLLYMEHSNMSPFCCTATTP